MSDKNLPNQVSANTLRRLPYYLSYLKTLKTPMYPISPPLLSQASLT